MLLYGPGQICLIVTTFSHLLAESIEAEMHSAAG